MDSRAVLSLVPVGRGALPARTVREADAEIDISIGRPDNDNQSSGKMRCVSKWLMKKGVSCGSI